jgi:hypothetical protein
MGEGGTGLISPESAQSQRQNMTTSTAGSVDKSQIPQKVPNSPLLAHSSVPPLAPLEYLQNQRKGSITDPSLHAAGSNINAVNKNNPRPAPSFVFSDVTARNAEESIPKIRKGRSSISNNGSRAMSGTQDHRGKSESL